MKKNWLWVGLIALTVFILDILTKIWAVYRLKYEEPIHIIPNYLRLEYAENTGIAFSLFQDQGQLLNILTPLAFIILIVLVYKQFGGSIMNWGSRIFLGLIIGGALGNILNRLYSGYVVDFIVMYYKTNKWPTFNLADTALTIGEVILIWKILFDSSLMEQTPVRETVSEESIQAKEGSADS